MSVHEDFSDWVINGSTECLFAKEIYDYEKARSETGWDVNSIIVREITSARLAKLSDAIIIADDHVQAFQIFFPSIVSEPELVDLIKALCELDEWYCWLEASKEGVGDPKLEDSVYVHLRWISVDNEYASQVMGTCGFDSKIHPEYRKAPVTSLIFRIGGPGDTIDIATDKPRRMSYETDSDGTTRLTVNLADMVPPEFTRQQVKSFWKKTKKNIKEIKERDPIAKHAPSGFTFVVSKKAAEALKSSETKIKVGHSA